MNFHNGIIIIQNYYASVERVLILCLIQESTREYITLLK